MDCLLSETNGREFQFPFKLENDFQNIFHRRLKILKGNYKTNLQRIWKRRDWRRDSHYFTLILIRTQTERLCFYSDHFYRIIGWKCFSSNKILAKVPENCVKIGQIIVIKYEILWNRIPDFLLFRLKKSGIFFKQILVSFLYICWHLRSF